MTRDTPECPECGADMKMRDGSRGEFWGCSTYPRCRGTREVEDDDPREIRLPSEHMAERRRHPWRD